MLETLVLLAFCLLVGLIALAICAYLLFTGFLFTLDGLSVALISLTIGGIFMANVGWSAYKGELKQLLAQRRKKEES